MLNRRKLALIAGAALAAAWVAWAFSPRPVDVEAATVTRGRFDLTIEEDGRTRLDERYTISAPVAARLARITLREGDRVAAGDTVARLMPVMSAMVDERSSREATARLKAAVAGVDRATAGMERAKLAQEEARLEQQRTEQLAAQGFVAPSRLDSTGLALAASQRALEMAEAERKAAVQEQARALAASRPSTPAMPEGSLLNVRSPVAGVVLRISLASEATIAAGTALLDIGDPSRMEVLCELLTTDAVRARPGSRVLIEGWGGPPVDGQVRRVEPAAFTKVSALGVEEQRVNVLITVADVPASWHTLGDGFRVSVKIVTQRQEQALMVPVAAVFPHGQGMAVYRVEGRRARLQAVELGGRNTSEAWVRSGLEVGQAVILYPPSAVKEGGRIRVRTP